MKKSHGFTLIELLAVLVIIVLIAVIATPIILNMIENSRKGALKSSAYGLLKDANFYYLQYELSQNVRFDIKDSVLQTKNIEPLLFNGKVEDATILINTQGKVALCINDGKYSAYKNYQDDTVMMVDNKTCSIPVGTSVVYLAGESTILEYTNQELTDLVTELQKEIQNLKDEKENLENELLTSNQYDLDEKVIGTWIDGKPLYRRGFKGVAGQGVERAADIALLDLSEFHIDVFTNAYGTILTDKLTNYITIPYMGGSAYFFSLYYKTTNHMLYLSIGAKYNSYTNNEYVIFIEYTKTTDSVS